MFKLTARMLLYTIGIYLYGFVLKIVSLFNGKARLWVRGRRRIIPQLKDVVSPVDRVVWIHCASLGEFEQGRPLIEAMREQQPEFKILLTFFSPSGYEIRKDYPGADWVFYLPLDTPRNARRFMKAVHPEIAIFVKYEFWLNYLKYMRKSDCRSFVVSAIFRRDSVFFKWYGSMFRRALRTFERIFVQNEESRELLAELEVGNVDVSGDTRFDRVSRIAEQARTLPVVERFVQGARVFVAGSTWPPDEEIIMEAIGAFPQVKFIIAPHEITQGRIDKFISDSPLRVGRYTECDENTDMSSVDILIINTMGILSSVYRYGEFAYIGGGFGAGIHNTLEAATFGLPLAFGPSYHKFREARELIESGAARSISSFDQLSAWLKELLVDDKLYLTKSKSASDYVQSHRGATSIIMQTLFTKE